MTTTTATVWLAGGAALCWIAGGPAAAGSIGNGFVYTDIVISGQFDSTAAAINDKGVVVGEYGINNGGLVIAHGYAWNSGSLSLIDPKPGKDGTYPQAISAKYFVVGYNLESKNLSGAHGFTYNHRNGKTGELDLVPVGTLPYGVNASGQIVGITETGNGTLGFIKTGANVTTLQAFGSTSTGAYQINASGSVAGAYLGGDNQYHGYVYSGGTFTQAEPPHAHGSTARAINAAGTVVGIYEDKALNAHGFMFKAGRATPIDVPGASFTNAVAINDKGQVAGTYNDSAGQNQYGYVRQNGSYVTIRPPAAVATTVTGLNNAGSVVGYYTGTDMENHAFIATCPAGVGQCTQ